MYKVSVPVMLRDGFDRECTLALVKRFGAERIMLALDGMSNEKYELTPDKAALLRESIDYFKSAGLTACVWINTLGHGGITESRDYTVTVNASGEPGGGYCPLDPAFTRDVQADVRRIAECGADELLLDDDYRLAFKNGGLGCFCERHLDAFAERFGKSLSRGELVKRVYTGRPSRERDVWLTVLGDSLADFARALRSAADEVNPTMRIGICASPSTWDTDGIDSLTLAKLLAGSTRPLLRFIGAPYWGAQKSWNQSVADTITLNYLESRWIAGTDVETLAEGDAYPRPRYMTPASYLEGFDAGIRAAGSADGILKYGVDYLSSPGYETGYARAHERDAELLRQIERRFAGKTAVGVNIIEPMRKLGKMTLPDEFAGGETIQNLFFPQSVRYLSDSSIPVGDGGAAAVFGGAAETVPLDSSGLILDRAAAEILTERGIDVGLRAVGERIYPSYELYADENERVVLTGGADWRAVTPDASAEIETVLSDGNTGSYYYENASGARFLVHAFTTCPADRDGAATRSYSRKRQIIKNAERLSKKPLDAYLETDSPDAYVYAARDDSSLAVLIWNAFPDAIESPVVKLAGDYSRVECFGADASLRGNRATLSELAPYGFAVLEAFK